jgi:hypothetical protein
MAGLPRSVSAHGGSALGQGVECGAPLVITAVIQTCMSPSGTLALMLTVQ